jgi:DNA-binding NarL/FixJ family response regulator
MSLHVIASNDTLLATLRSSLQQNALPLASAVLRTPGSNLLASLQALDDAPPGAIVLLDSPISFESTANDDLVVLDGWLRQRPHLNVLLLSEDNSKALLTRAMRAGVREVLQLPPDPTELAQTLRRWRPSTAEISGTSPAERS